MTSAKSLDGTRTLYLISLISRDTPWLPVTPKNMSTFTSSSLPSSPLPLLPLLYLGLTLVAILPWVHPLGVAGSSTTDRQIGGGTLNSPRTLDQMLEEVCLNPETCKVHVVYFLNYSIYCYGRRWAGLLAGGTSLGAAREKGCFSRTVTNRLNHGTYNNLTSGCVQLQFKI